MNRPAELDVALKRAEPLVHQHAPELQACAEHAAQMPPAKAG